MRCPNCNYQGSRVVDSRPADDGSVTRRRRECEACHFRFTTFERIEQPQLLVVKKNGDRQEFSPEKLLRGIHRAFEKRPVSAEEQEEIVNRIERRVRDTGMREISSRELGEYVMDELAAMDDVAYIRFASVYREFKDINVFLKAMKDLEKRTSISDDAREIDE
ncbi:transcriptional regulator NrdR [Allofustis seminis]|uniref:transcriptional regulator NrdR n=1 Tax=Allofustis seminis TaxID=166939 RepID=UPI00037E05A9|nr:transcriptional regulator NrdR [Allofustis seminis]